MKAITVQQPWAWAIVHGGKNVENRTRIGTWRGLVGLEVAVHAGRRWSFSGQISGLVWTALAARGWPTGPKSWDEVRGFARGAIIGLVDVVDVHPEHGGCCQPWGEQSYVEHGGRKRVDIVHLVLERPRPVEPVPCAGMLGAWTVSDAVARQVITRAQ